MWVLGTLHSPQYTLHTSYCERSCGINNGHIHQPMKKKTCTQFFNVLFLSFFIFYFVHRSEMKRKKKRFRNTEIYWLVFCFTVHHLVFIFLTIFFYCFCFAKACFRLPLNVFICMHEQLKEQAPKLNLFAERH